jgi:hypothetical protein
MVRMSFPVVTNTSSPLPLVALRLRRWALAVAWLAAAWLAAGPAVAQETLDQSNAPAS